MDVINNHLARCLQRMAFNFIFGVCHHFIFVYSKRLFDPETEISWHDHMDLNIK